MVGCTAVCVRAYYAAAAACVRNVDGFKFVEKTVRLAYRSITRVRYKEIALTNIDALCWKVGKEKRRSRTHRIQST